MGVTIKELMEAVIKEENERLKGYFSQRLLVGDHGMIIRN